MSGTNNINFQNSNSKINFSFQNVLQPIGSKFFDQSEGSIFERKNVISELKTLKIEKNGNDCTKMIFMNKLEYS